MARTKISILQEYRAYLKRSNLTEEMLLDIQNTEMKRAFFAGFSSFLMAMKNDISQLTEEQGIAAFDDIQEQCMNFWIQESEEQDRKEKN